MNANWNDSFDRIVASVNAVDPDGALPRDSPEMPLDGAYTVALTKLAEDHGYTVKVEAPSGKHSHAEGLTNIADKRIYLHPTSVARPSRAWRLLMHEASHAIYQRPSLTNFDYAKQVVRLIARIAGNTTFDPETTEGMVFTLSYGMSHIDHLVEVASLREELVVELACALAQDRLGHDYRFASAYLAAHFATAETLGFVREEAETLADTFVELLGGITEEGAVAA